MSKAKKEAYAKQQAAATAASAQAPLGSPFESAPMPKSEKKHAGRKQSKGK